MFNIVPLFLIIVSLGVIVVIIARKYPELTLLDLDTIPDRKEKQIKKEILGRKASKRAKDQQIKILQRLIPVKNAWKRWQSSFRLYVRQLRYDVETRKNPTRIAIESTSFATKNLLSEGEKTIDDILKKGKRALEERKFQEAEISFIRAIEIDKKNVFAYEGLGDVYAEQGQFEEAKETYFFAKKLDLQNVSLLLKLASLAEQSEAWTQAIGYYEEAILVDDANASFFAKLAELFLKARQVSSAFEAINQAVELRPKHLPYLDTLVEISIIMQDKGHAEEGIYAIRMIDPEYNRIELFKDRIAEMPT